MIVDIEVLKCYYDLLDCTEPEIVLFGGSLSGKTFYGLDWLWVKGLEDTGGFSLCIMEDMTSVRSDCFEPMCARLDSFGIPFKRRDSAPHEIILPSGHRIIFTSSSRSSGERSSERLKKFTDAKRVFVNEITAISRKDYIMLKNRMGRSKNIENPQIMSAFNPIEKNHWCVTEWVYPHMDGVLPNERTRTVKTTYLDNINEKTGESYLSQSAIDNLLYESSRNPNYARVYRDGVPGVYEGLVYTEGIHWELVEEDEWPIPDDLTPISNGVDWGSHTTASVAVWIFEGKRYAMELMYEPGYNQKMLEARLNQIYDEHEWLKDNTSLRCDHELDRIYSLAMSGFRRQGEIWPPGDPSNGAQHVCIPAYKDVSFGIDQVMESKIYVHAGSKNLRDELRNYIWDPRASEKDIERKPMKGYDHAVDSLRYALAYKPMALTPSGSTVARITPKARQRPSYSNE